MLYIDKREKRKPFSRRVLPWFLAVSIGGTGGYFGRTFYDEIKDSVRYATSYHGGWEKYEPKTDDTLWGIASLPKYEAFNKNKIRYLIKSHNNLGPWENVQARSSIEIPTFNEPKKN